MFQTQKRNPSIGMGSVFLYIQLVRGTDIGIPQ